MDLLQALEGAQAAEEWVRFPETDFEVRFKPLSTKSFNRITTSTTTFKKGKIKSDTARLINEAYPQVITAFRGLTINIITAKKFFNIKLAEGSITNGNGQPLGPDEHVNSDPINEAGLKMMIFLGLQSTTFHMFIVNHGGLNPRSEEDYESEEEHTKKTL